MSNRLIDRHRMPTDVPWSEADRRGMNRARELARAGAGRTGRNPIVGAVVIAGDVEVGSGFHRQRGDAHAEVVALDAAGAAARGATLFVSLEPCSHQGRTPPCVERILHSGVARVVCPTIDPDMRVRGRGVAALRAAGVRVDVGCMADAAILDALAFYKNRLELGTSITLKMAMSADGMVARAPGRRDDVTAEVARTDVHALRALHDAVVVGVETVRIDRPRLDCRLLADGVEGNPTPVVLDTHARTPVDVVWAREGRAFVVVCGRDADASRVDALQRAGARVLRVRAGANGVDIDETVEALAGLGLASLWVEGGPRVFWSFVDAGKWDGAWLYRSAETFGAGGVPWARTATDTRLGRVVDDRALGVDDRIGIVNDASWPSLAAALAAAGE